METFFISLIFASLWLALYLLPAIMASHWNHPGAVWISLLNIFLGWTVIGWIIALIWTFFGIRATRVTAKQTTDFAGS